MWMIFSPDVFALLQRNLEKIRNISSSAIESANPWRQVKTASLVYCIISFMFDVEYFYKLTPVNRFLNLMAPSYFTARGTSDIFG